MKSKIGPMMNRRVRELGLISVLAAFCGGLAFAHDRQLFAAAFAAAAVVRPAPGLDDTLSLSETYALKYW
jgi:hypothetical protein